MDAEEQGNDEKNPDQEKFTREDEAAAENERLKQKLINRNAKRV